MRAREVADELYGLPLEEFVASRDARAAETRRAGDKELAAQIKALRKPTTAAWLLNQLVRAEHAGVQDLLTLGEELRAAQAQQDGATMRDLDRRRRELSRDLSGRVRALGAERGHRVTDAVATEVEVSLRAATADPDAAAALASGLLVGSLEASGFEPLDVSGLVALPVPPAPRAHLRLVPEPAAEPEPTPEPETVVDTRLADDAEDEAHRAFIRLAEVRRRLADLEARLDEVARDAGFSGVVRVDLDGETVVARAWGLADRAHAVPNEVDTRFAIASGSKLFTALATMSLVAEGELSLGTRVREVLGDDLPLVDDEVTVEHLLSHRSGIGDYLDEEVVETVDAYVMSVPVHELATTEDYLRVLEGHPQAFPPGERYVYNNAGYVVAALVAERVSGVPFPDLVEERVLRPAGMTATAYLRSDELPGDAARHYLHRDGLRTNVLHLPVRGSGDGGAFTTAGDLAALWAAMDDERIVAAEHVAEMARARSVDSGGGVGLGLHLNADKGTRWVGGYDAGVSMSSAHDPGMRMTATVLANWSEGAWPLVRLLREAETR